MQINFFDHVKSFNFINTNNDHLITFGSILIKNSSWLFF